MIEFAPFAERRDPLPGTNWSGAPASKIGVCLHTIVGSLDSADNEFHTAGVQLSAHYGVAGPGESEPDGHVVQWVGSSSVAYAQADGNWPPHAYISIETGGTVDTPWSDAQIEAIAGIIRWEAAQWGFPVVHAAHDAPGVTQHCNGDGSADPAWGNHTCPGSVRLAQIPRIIQLANEGDIVTDSDKQAIIDGCTKVAEELFNNQYTPVFNEIKARLKAIEAKLGIPS